MNLAEQSDHDLPEAAIKHLREFYEKAEALDAPSSKKIELLEQKLGGQIHLYACGGEVTEQMILNNLEHDFLCEDGLLKRVLC